MDKNDIYFKLGINGTSWRYSCNLVKYQLLYNYMIKLKIDEEIQEQQRLKEKEEQLMNIDLDI